MRVELYVAALAVSQLVACATNARPDTSGYDCNRSAGSCTAEIDADQAGVWLKTNITGGCAVVATADQGDVPVCKGRRFMFGPESHAGIEIHACDICASVTAR